MPYLFFDLDHTLLDDTHTKDHYLPKLYEAFRSSIAADYPAFKAAWTGAIIKHYQRYVDGELTFDQQRHERIKEAFGTPLSQEQVLAADQCFLTHFEASWKLFKGWREYFDTSLLPKCLITNGNGPQQRRKLAKLGITDEFQHLVISEEAGCVKPNRPIFELAMKKMGCTAGDSIMIGDSFALDIKGGLGAGMAAFWINHEGAPVPEVEGRLEVFGTVAALIDRLRKLEG